MIRKSEYNKALKIVDAYRLQLQQRENKRTVTNHNLYGFLWFDCDGGEHHRWIKAKDIDSACKRFEKIQPKTMVRLDFEVQNVTTYFDISEREEFKHLI
jgi:hypothetical protein